MLHYLLTQTLEGRGGQLKEYVIGVEVFDRGESFDTQTDAIVRTELSRLRAKLTGYRQSEGCQDALIVDLPPRSYSLAFRPNESSSANPKSKLRRTVTATLLIIGLGACLMLATRFLPRQEKPDINLNINLTSLAVLPFVNLSAGPEAEHFADGLTDQIISCLAEIDGLRVVSRASAFQFKGKQEDLRTVAAQLKAGMVLEGTVHQSGNRLRITTRLVDATGHQLHSHVYERGIPGDVDTVQEEIARQVANALRIHGRGGGTIQHLTKSAEAYGHYLQGRHQAHHRKESELRKAIDCYQRAIAADPNYAPAHASLADAYILLALLTEAPPRETMHRAKQAAQDAIRTGGALPRAHSALGSVLALYDRDWTAAEKEFRRAREQDPNDSGILEAYAMRYLLPQGHLDSALFEMQFAQSLDPFSPEIVLSLGTVHHFKRDPDRAIETFQRVLRLEPDFETAPLALAAAYAQKSLVDQALATLHEASAPTQDEARLAVLGQVYALSRQPDRARQVLERLRDVSRQRFVSGYYLARLHVALGETAQALDWLEKAAGERCPLIVYLKVDPQFDKLRAEPRFRALTKMVGLGE